MANINQLMSYVISAMRHQHVKEKEKARENINGMYVLIVISISACLIGGVCGRHVSNNGVVMVCGVWPYQ